MSIRPFRDIKRRKTKKIKVGKIEVGGDAPISVQSMTNTLTININDTVKQINELAEAGADLILVSRTQKDLSTVQKTIRKLKRKCTSITCDVSNYDETKKLFSPSCTNLQNLRRKL